MIEGIGTVKNPLTIIAMFAALVEVSGTIVLPFVDANNQIYFIWFLILFPIILVILFFCTLNFNHKVLYAPSDYENEENFLKLFIPVSPEEKIQRIKSEYSNEIIDAGKSNNDHEDKKIDIVNISPDNNKSFLKLAYNEAKLLANEEFVLQHMSKEFSAEIKRNMRLDDLRYEIYFDGLVYEKGNIIGIEVKTLQKGTRKIVSDSINKLLNKINGALNNEVKDRFHLIIVYLYNERDVDIEVVKSQMNPIIRELSYEIELRFFSLSEIYGLKMP